MTAQRAGFSPQRDRLREIARLRVVVRQQLRLVRHAIGNVALQARQRSGVSSARLLLSSESYAASCISACLNV